MALEQAARTALECASRALFDVSAMVVAETPTMTVQSAQSVWYKPAMCPVDK